VGQVDNPNLDIEKALEAVAIARYLISSFAEDLVSLLDQDMQVETIPEDIAAKQNAVEALLDDRPGNEGIVRSMRLFLVKQLERKKGISFARGALQQEPLESAKWVISWKESGDTGFVRFLGTNRLPQQNPLQNIPGFHEMREILASYLTTGNLQLLGEEISNLAEALGADIVKGSLVAGLFYEIHLLSAVMSEADQADPANVLFGRIQPLREWLLSANHEALDRLFTGSERKTFALFTGGSGKDGSAAQAMLHLDTTSTTENILRVRFIAHATACAFQSSFYTWVRNLMLNPGSMVDSFVPTMPEDLTKMAQNVMGGRWYSCPNGHPFYVDLCGRPTVIQQCAECGVDIGGTDHNLLQGNIDIGNVGEALYQTTTLEDHSEKNYCLREAQVEAEDRYYTARMLGPMSIQSLRLIMHAVMVVGVAAGGPEWEESARTILNQTFCNPTNMSAFFTEHFNCNWTSLKTLLNRSSDDMSVLLHLGLLSSAGSTSVLDTPPPYTGDPLPELPEYTGGAISSEYRSAWEANFHCLHFQHHVSEINLEERLEKANDRFNPQGDEGDSGGAFFAEIQEKFEVEALSADQRRREMPALWGYRRPFSFDHFSMSLNMLAKQKERHFLLATFLEQEKELRSLCHLPAVFKWLQLLLKRYNRRLDRMAARELTVGKVLGDVGDSDRPQWEAAFLGFQSAWNLSWRSVERFGCTRIPADFVQMEMGLDVPITFCLPTDTDEGICPLALVRYLVDQHNNFVQAVDERILMSRRSTHRADSRTPSVSSRHFTLAHAISYNLMGDFIPFLEKQCVSITSSGEYDFKKAEARLLNHYFPTVPAMDLELRAFVFAHEQHLSGGMAPLRQKVKQQPLPPDTEDAIRRDITTPAQASRCIEVLETAISFLTATGGSFMKRLDETVGEMMLLQYLRTVLLMDDTTQIGSRAIIQQVQLKHLEALWNLLSSITEVDPLENISQRYTEPLSDRMSKLLKTRGKLMEIGTLIPLLKGFIVNQLIEGTMDPESKAKDNIGWIDTGDVYLMDLPWFLDNWPDSMPLKNIVAAYKLLENISV